jgi:hypothetical protein
VVKQDYETLELEVIELVQEDIIITSCGEEFTPCPNETEWGG